jgi:hypothetical protein
LPGTLVREISFEAKARLFKFFVGHAVNMTQMILVETQRQPLAVTHLLCTDHRDERSWRKVLCAYVDEIVARRSRIQVETFEFFFVELPFML